MWPYFSYIFKSTPDNISLTAEVIRTRIFITIPKCTFFQKTLTKKPPDHTHGYTDLRFTGLLEDNILKVHEERSLTLRIWSLRKAMATDHKLAMAYILSDLSGRIFLVRVFHFVFTDIEAGGILTCWGGTEKALVLMSTLVHLSNQGMIKTIPGPKVPLRWPILKTINLSHCLSLLKQNHAVHGNVSPMMM